MSGVPIRYLAMGDSYTIGTGASGEASNFPSRLARRLEAATHHRVEVRNPAVNGFTTADLISRELDQLETFGPDLVTILVGANDVVQRVPEATYRTRLRQIYAAVGGLGLPPGQVVGITVPDFSVVPAAPEFGTPADLRRRIDAINQIAREEAGLAAFEFVDHAELSRTRAAQPGWIAADGLHPADAQYAAWAEFFWERLGPTWSGVRPRA